MEEVLTGCLRKSHRQRAESSELAHLLGGGVLGETLSQGPEECPVHEEQSLMSGLESTWRAKSSPNSGN